MAVTTIPTAGIADTAISTAKIADNSITNVKTAFDDVPFRNIIINGDMSVAQRATSSTGIGASDGYFTVDRFQYTKEGSPSARFTQSQSTVVPSGQGFASSIKMDCTTAQSSLSSGDGFNIQHKIEGQNLQLLKYGTSSAVTLTLSFWVRATKTGTNIVWIYQNDDSRSQAQAYTISSADTWEKKTLTFVADTTGVIDNNNGEGFRISWWLGAGTNFQSGSLATTWQSHSSAITAVGQVNHADNTANDFYLTGVQLEVGTTASDFEFIPYDVNFARCMRYYQDYSGFILWTTALDGNTSTRLGGSITFNTTMRATPSVTNTNNTGTIESQNITHKAYSVYAEKSNRGTNTNVQNLKFDAEL
jgi:hypothetical protein